jgi:hypothetical protein
MILDPNLSARRIRKLLDSTILETIRLREDFDLGDIPIRLHKLRDEMTAIEHELHKDKRQIDMW